MPSLTELDSAYAGLNCKVWSPIMHASEIELLARGMSEKEVLSFYGMDYDSLEAAGDADDLTFFKRAYQRGRVKGIHTAVDALFEAMRDSRHGRDASVSYLIRFAEKWESEGVDTSSGRTFRFIME